MSKKKIKQKNTTNSRRVLVAVLAVAAGLCLFWAVGGMLQSREDASETVAASEADEETNTKAKAETIANNITINGVDVSGMTASEAKRALEPTIDRYMDADIALSTKEGSIHATTDDFMVTSDVDDVIDKALGYGQAGNLVERFKESQRMANGEEEALSISFTPEAYAIERFLESHEEELGKEAKDNTVVRENGAFVFVKGENGYTVNVDESVEDITSYFADKWDGADCSIDLALNEIKPRGDEEDFAKMRDVLGTYTTQYGSSPSGRKTNIINGGAKVNGSVLFPGDEISVAAKLAPITEENGYAEGTAYENGQVVPSVGGGVCQISSTLYNAAILAELEITERFAHSMTVSYVEPSRDAAIAGTINDLKFKNNLSSPIYIDIATSDSAITATVYGEETRPAGRKVEFESEILSKTDPTTVYVADSSLPIGSKSGGGDAHTGYSARLWKIVTENGKEDREIFNTSYYSVKNAEYHIGTSSISPEGSAAVSAAVATQDIDAINAAIAQWNDSAIAARIEEAQAGEGGDDGEGTAIVAEESLGGAVAAE